jgi:hypothetical protein
MTTALYHRLQFRILVPITLLVIAVVATGSYLMVRNAQHNVGAEIQRESQQQMGEIVRTLDITKNLIDEQVHGSMRLLTQQGAQLGAPSLGAPVELGGKMLPNLLLGKTSEVNQFDLVDGVTKMFGGTATLFVRSGDDFVRVSTNVKKPDGTRAIGTLLDPKGRSLPTSAMARRFMVWCKFWAIRSLRAMSPCATPAARSSASGMWATRRRSTPSRTKSASSSYCTAATST